MNQLTKTWWLNHNLLGSFVLDKTQSRYALFPPKIGVPMISGTSYECSLLTSLAISYRRSVLDLIISKYSGSMLDLLSQK